MLHLFLDQLKTLWRKLHYTCIHVQKPQWVVILCKHFEENDALIWLRIIDLVLWIIPATSIARSSGNKMVRLCYKNILSFLALVLGYYDKFRILILFPYSRQQTACCSLSAWNLLNLLHFPSAGRHHGPRRLAHGPQGDGQHPNCCTYSFGSWKAHLNKTRLPMHYAANFT